LEICQSDPDIRMVAKTGSSTAIYASHYFETALDLSVCVRDNSQPDGRGFYLITVKGSRQAGLTGPKGAIIRKAALSRIRSSLEASLLQAKRVLESSQ